MNNSGAIYLEYPDREAVLAALPAIFAQSGYVPSNRPPEQLSGRIMIPEKPWRHLLLAAPSNGWIAIWEDPRYFAQRELAQALAKIFGCRALWIEVGGNGVSWARGLYQGETTLDEHYEPVTTTFYGEYGVVFLAFDTEHMPEELIAELGLPYSELHYESALASQLPDLRHCCFERL